MASETKFPILHLSRSGPIYGLGRQLLYLVRGLDRERFPATVAVDEAGALHDAVCVSKIDCSVWRMSPWRSFFYFVPRYVDARRLLALAREKKSAIVHAHDVWRAEYAYFIAERLDIPSVVHVRGPLARRDIIKHRLSRADAVIAIAQRYVDDLLAAGIAAERIVLIDDTVDLDLFSAARFPRHDGSDKLVRVGMVGRISPEKRVREFLRIVAALSPQVLTSSRFEIVGDWTNPSYRREVEADIDRLHLHKVVHFSGGVASEDMPEKLAGLDVLVTLGGGSVMFEAMAMETPVLSIRTDDKHSLHTRHNETAWCVSTDRREPAAEALSLLITDAELRRRLGFAGRSWIEEYLSAARMVEMTRSLYEQLLSRKAALLSRSRSDLASAERASANQSAD